MLLNVLPSLLQGTLVTLQVFFATLILSLPLACLLQALQQFGGKPVRQLFQLYVTLMRGTPLLLQLMFVFFGMPYLGVTLSRESSILIAFVLNYTAYFLEILRGSLSAVDPGQQEAGRMLGFSRAAIYFRILLPQAFRTAMPSIGNEVLNLVKDTSLIYVLGATDLLKAGRAAVNTYATALPFVAVGAIYLALCGGMALIMKRIERHLDKGTGGVRNESDC